MTTVGGGGRGGQFLQERSEAEIGIEVAQRGQVRLAPGESIPIELDRGVGGDAGKLLRENHLFAAVEQRFAIALVFDLGGVVEGCFDRSKAPDQFARAFIADAFGAGDVVDGIAHQGHDVGDLLGRDAHDFFDFGGIEDDIGLAGALAGPQDANAAADQLHHVFVAGDDVDVDVAARRTAGRARR